MIASLGSQGLSAWGAGSATAGFRSHGARAGPKASVNGEELTPEEERQVERLKRQDAEVRRRAQARVRAAQPDAQPPTYSYERGPDGKQYAKSAQVAIDTSGVPGDPDATVEKMKRLKRVARNAQDPFAKDKAVEARAEEELKKARREMSEEMRQEVEQRRQGMVGVDAETAADRYEKIRAGSFYDPESRLRATA